MSSNGIALHIMKVGAEAKDAAEERSTTITSAVMATGDEKLAADYCQAYADLEKALSLALKQHEQKMEDSTI